MPVHFDTHDPDGRDLRLRGGTNAYAILSFLGERPELGHTQTEIHEGTGVPRGSVGPTLHRLEERGLIRHKGRYWAIAEDDRLASVEATGHGWAALEARDGDDWYGRNPGWVTDSEHARPVDGDSDTNGDSDTEGDGDEAEDDTETSR